MPVLFGAKLRRLREATGLTQTEITHRLGLTSQSHIAKLEAGQDRPSLDVVARTADLFSMPIDDLLRDTTLVESLQVTSLGSAQTATVDAAQLGERVRALRLMRGWTQAALAHQLGPSGQSGIGKIERGEKLPSLERLECLADVLNVTVDDLVRPALRTHSDSL
ncbi:MAG: helix-turn-helix transcriptional regulator [Oscillochloris sp.]|nr:helix-turn-helix transcriptional regulator [Oscillochloris sp.]